LFELSSRISMRGLPKVLFAGLVMSSAAHAQEWRTYTYPDAGVAIQFPGVPEVQTSRFKNAAGVTLPVTRYAVRLDGVQYTLTVVNYSSTNADSLGVIGETARSFSAKGKVIANTRARINRSWGRKLTVAESDGSRCDVAIFFVDNHLYTAVGQALPSNRTDRSADTVRFQQSLQFPDDDGDLHGLPPGGGKAGSNTAASTVTRGSGSGASSAGSGSSASGASSAGSASNADAACVGKSAGDPVQLNTSTGPVAATCTLTARPNPPRAAPPNQRAFP
jgi:hypothetical protein